MTPQELESTGWLHKVGGRVLSPPVAVTCTMGAGSHIDFAVIDENLEALIVGIEVDTEAEWKPHLGYTIWLSSEPEIVTVEKIMSAKKMLEVEVNQEDAEEM